MMKSKLLGVVVLIALIVSITLAFKSPATMLAVYKRQADGTCKFIGMYNPGTPSDLLVDSAYYNNQYQGPTVPFWNCNQKFRVRAQN